MKKCTIYSNVMVPSYYKATGIPEPGKRPFNFIAAFITPQLTAVMVSLLFIIIPVRANQLNSPVSQALTKGIAVISFIGNKPLRILTRPTPVFTWHGDIVYRFFEERGLVMALRRL